MAALWNTIAKSVLIPSLSYPANTPRVPPPLRRAAVYISPATAPGEELFLLYTQPRPHPIDRACRDRRCARCRDMRGGVVTSAPTHTTLTNQQSAPDLQGGRAPRSRTTATVAPGGYARQRPGGTDPDEKTCLRIRSHLCRSLSQYLRVFRDSPGCDRAIADRIRNASSPKRGMAITGTFAFFSRTPRRNRDSRIVQGSQVKWASGDVVMSACGVTRS